MNKFFTYFRSKLEPVYGFRIKMKYPAHSTCERQLESQRAYERRPRLPKSSSANVNDVSILSHIINISLVVREQFAYDRA